MSQAEEVSVITTGNPEWKTEDRNKSGRKTGKGQLPTTSKQPGQIKYKFCHRTHARKKELCPTWQQKCGNCGQMNHFSVACNSRKANKQPSKKSVVHNLEQQSPDFSEEDSDDYLFTVESMSAVHTKYSPKKIFANVQLRDETVKFSWTVVRQSTFSQYIYISEFIVTLR